MKSLVTSNLKTNAISDSNTDSKKLKFNLDNFILFLISLLISSDVYVK